MSDNLSPQKKAWLTRKLKLGSKKEIEVTPSTKKSYPGIPYPNKDKSNLKGKYDYVTETDTYVTFLKGEVNPIFISGDTHRAMCRDYSNWIGPESTVQSICVKYDFPKAKFAEYKDIHGWSHDAPPFTKEELIEKDVETLTKDLISSKTSDLKAKVTAKESRDNKVDAEKWRDYEYSLKSGINRLLYEHESYNIPLLDIPEAERPYAVVVPPLDLHFGKSSWQDETGTLYSRRECSALLKFHTEDLISRFIKLGRPDEIIWVAGSDYLHIDNDNGSTTGGTRQDLDGTPGVILKEGFELAIEHIDMLRQIAPVKVILASGNHDQHSSIALLMFIQAWYRNTEDVYVDLSMTPRNYMTYGNTLIAVSHGDKTTAHIIAKMIPHEARELWSEMEHTALFTGHLHYELSRDDLGIQLFQVPSLSGADRWHSRAGYTLSRRALAAYIIDAEDGPIGQIFSPVRNKSALFGFKKSNWSKKR